MLFVPTQSIEGRIERFGGLHKLGDSVRIQLCSVGHASRFGAIPEDIDRMPQCIGGGHRRYGGAKVSGKIFTKGAYVDRRG